MSQVRHQSEYVLPLEEEVQRHGGPGTEAHEGARGGESSAEADVLRAEYGERCAEGAHLKKALTPPDRREAVEYLVAEQGLSVQRSCRAVGLSRSAWYRGLSAKLERDRMFIEVLQAASA